ncbi:MAG: hypothetical protein IJS67_04630, partial [Clostridia bacterium]|nr:hypothetical protein [Clostridia bacterium]
MTKRKTIRLALIALIGVLALSLSTVFAYGGTGSANAAATETTFKYFGSNDATVTNYTGRTSNSMSSASQFGVEFTPTGSKTDVTIYSNMAINPRASTAADLATLAATNKGEIFVFDKYVVNSENQAVADMVVLTYTSLADQTKQLSIVNYVNSGNYSAFALSFTDDLVYSNGTVSIAGTNQNVLGLSSGSYVSSGSKQSGAAVKTGGAVFGSGTQIICITGAGDVCHNGYWTFGNILDSAFLTASSANLTDTAYESLYTSEWASSVLAAMNGNCYLTIRYYNLHTGNNAIGFNYRTFNGKWLGDAYTANPAVTVPYSRLKDMAFYVGKSYTAYSVLDTYNYYVNGSGETPIALYGWTDNNNRGDSTWFHPGNKRSFTLNSAGTRQIFVYTYANVSGQSYSDKYLGQTFDLTFVDGTPTVSTVTTPATLYLNQTYDISSYFNISYDGAAGDYEVSYALNDSAISPSYKPTVECEDQVISITVTNTVTSQSATTSFTADFAYQTYTNYFSADNAEVVSYSRKYGNTV